VKFSKLLAHTNFVGGLCHRGKINQTFLCVRIWMVLVRLTIKDSEDIACSSNLILDITHQEIICDPLVLEGE
jgi:hypothetical protein